ncbi:MAG: hypothetical protein JSW07_01515 [bacterium]|nr:MAG: hypothetical protein JSW07_01515 [bacterium]
MIQIRVLKFAIFLLLIIMILLSFKETSAQINESLINLPKTIGLWTRSDSVQKIDSQNIFKYMDGAGELYLGYRFNHLDVYEYTADNQNNILVELYWMDTSDDAFGLLSLDWGGQSVTLSESPLNQILPTIVPSSRALYGAGLLRIWSDNLYARIMAYQETPVSKEAVLFLGRVITANRKNPFQPELLKILSSNVGSEWILRNDRINYFRSYLVLNSFYYLSHQNILNLDLSTEAVTVPYEIITATGDRKRVQFLFVKYANSDRARKAMNYFHEAYLPDQSKDSIEDFNAKSPHLFKIEDGWVGYFMIGKFIALIFECPDQESGLKILNQIEINLQNLEDEHGQ